MVFVSIAALGDYEMLYHFMCIFAAHGEPQRLHGDLYNSVRTEVSLSAPSHALVSVVCIWIFCATT